MEVYFKILICLVYTTRREKSDSLFSDTIYQFDLNNLTFYFSFCVGRLQLNFNALKITKRKNYMRPKAFLVLRFSLK